MTILGGLELEYGPFVIPITSMQREYPLPEVTTLLLTHEARLEHHNQVEALAVNMENTIVAKKGSSEQKNKHQKLKHESHHSREKRLW